MPQSSSPELVAMCARRAHTPAPSSRPEPESAVAVLDAVGRVVACDAAVERLVGHSPGSLVGLPASELLLAPGDGAAIAARAARCRTGESLEGEAALRHRDGHGVEVRLRASRLAAAEGSPAVWHVSAVRSAAARRSEAEYAILEGLVAQSPIGLAIYGPDLRLTRVNPALEKIHGIPASESVGKRISEVYPWPEGDAMERRLEAVLRTGVPQLTTEHRGRTPADPDHDHVWSISSFRIRDPAGGLAAVASSVVDITERHRARERLTLLNTAGERIGTRLDVTRTAEELTRVLVPALADFVAVDLLEGVAQGEPPPPGAPDITALLRRTALRSVREHAPEASYPVGELMTFPAATPLGECLTGGAARLIPVLHSAEDWFAQDPVRAATMLGAGIHSLMLVPLRARDTTLGVVHMYRWQRPEPFERDDLALATELVARAALCVDNARLYTREHRSALALQNSLLIGALPEQNSVRVAHRHVAAAAHGEVGGDWFDVIPLSGARVALVVGDVPGRGIHATAHAARWRSTIQTLASLDPPPDELLTQLDHAVGQATDIRLAAGEPTPSVGTTCLYAVFDPVSRRCTIASAGHLPPALVGPDGTADLLPVPVGPPLGLGGVVYESTRVDIADGATLALFTNGLVTGRDRDVDASLASLCGALAAASGSLDERCGSVVNALLPQQPLDDAVLLLGRLRALPSTSVATWELPSDPAVVGRARSLATGQLRDWGLDDLGLTTELIVSELVTNAIRYGRPPVRLRLIRHRSLICEVTDGASTAPHVRFATESDEGGRGLFMIAQLADRWGTRYTKNGKTIWAEQQAAAG
ncbi:SpoIIE family protein phosphatase [Streptomyces sp. NPDC047971]|uniref:SpoIIE family protein phosphatase n=1 Tax=Streptomyces sp. NPDC047971 TaxID=3154499 RepID=UPI0033D0012B